MNISQWLSAIPGAVSYWNPTTDSFKRGWSWDKGKLAKGYCKVLGLHVDDLLQGKWTLQVARSMNFWEAAKGTLSMGVAGLDNTKDF